ncbi:hypothetical protein PHYPSEUDO_002661 [Phytophthora pseudosyringae]|uniref:Uncharacterized protein n=1 Tax=Phytophthora pseudosyringae TaxID=221518 RepID=A0A8T1V2T8_9STRA|nr:hypothetical protein PHYPSEUDO_002661 [Phytophthora pseudosyringae]
MPTAILTFIRFIPSEVAHRCGKKKVGQFLELAETSGNEDGSDIVRMMESLLLDDSHIVDDAVMFQFNQFVYHGSAQLPTSMLDDTGAPRSAQAVR